MIKQINERQIYESAKQQICHISVLKERNFICHYQIKAFNEGAIVVTAIPIQRRLKYGI